MALDCKPFDDCLDEHIKFIKQYRLGPNELAYKYKKTDLGEICAYLGLNYIKGEKELESAVRLAKFLGTISKESEVERSIVLKGDKE